MDRDGHMGQQLGHERWQLHRQWQRRNEVPHRHRLQLAPCELKGSRQGAGGQAPHPQLDRCRENPLFLSESPRITIVIRYIPIAVIYREIRISLLSRISSYSVCIYNIRTCYNQNTLKYIWNTHVTLGGSPPCRGAGQAAPDLRTWSAPLRRRRAPVDLEGPYEGGGGDGGVAGRSCWVGRGCLAGWGGGVLLGGEGVHGGVRGNLACVLQSSRIMNSISQYFTYT